MWDRLLRTAGAGTGGTARQPTSRPVILATIRRCRSAAAVVAAAVVAAAAAVVAEVAKLRFAA
jgi:hypothetical protein